MTDTPHTTTDPDTLQPSLFNSPAALVGEFHRSFDLTIGDVPELPSEELCELRLALTAEELDELAEALKARDLVEVADALADIVYVVYGSAISFGIDLDEVLEEVHRSNMSKLGHDGKAVTRSDGKVIKGPQYEEPDVEGVLRRATNRPTFLGRRIRHGTPAIDRVEAAQATLEPWGVPCADPPCDCCVEVAEALTDD